MSQPHHDFEHALQGLDTFLDATPNTTPLDQLHYYWRRVSQEDRLRFLIEMLTPNERRALLLGFEEDEDASGSLILHLTPQPDGGYVVTSPTHPALLTDGDTVADALEHAKDAYEAVCEMEEEP